MASDAVAALDGLARCQYRQSVASTRVEPAPYLIPLSFDGSEVLSVDASSPARGWAAYLSPTVTQLGTTVVLRITPQPPPATPAGGGTDTALEVRELRVTAGESSTGFASSLLREIPILRIEAAINQSTHRRRIAAYLAGAGAHIDQVPGGTRYHRPPARRPAIRRRSLAVEDPGGYRKPDAFYRHVADLYLHLAAVTARPAHELAEANNVPVATVHRWIREAKARRILLLPAHRSGADRSDPVRRTKT
jgi:hypothetical protein